MQKNNKEFWVVNKTNTNVSLRDLGITIAAHAKVNLLDSKHYYFTEEQLEQSKNSGSLFKKSNLLACVQRKPKNGKRNIIEVTKPHILVPARNPSVVVTIPKYEELEISEEQAALEAAEFAEYDHAPAAIAVDAKFDNSIKNET